MALTKEARGSFVSSFAAWRGCDLYLSEPRRSIKVRSVERGPRNAIPMSYPRYGVKQISEVANGLIDPVLARRAGINTSLLGSWDEIVGEDFADCTRPEKIAWAKRGGNSEDGGYQPGVLTIACEGAR